MEEENNELTPQQDLQLQTEKLDASISSTVANLIKSDDPREIKDLTVEFNLAQSKKNILRSLTLNDLLDKVSSKVYDRIEYSAGEMKDSDLIEYLKVTQDILDKTLKNSHTTESADAIQLTQQNVNINIGENLNRESRERVVDVVNTILNRINKENINDNSEIVDSNS